MTLKDLTLEQKYTIVTVAFASHLMATTGCTQEEAAALMGRCSAAVTVAMFPDFERQETVQ
jgi:hypothetical protein